MAQYFRPMFKKIKDEIVPTVCSTSAANVRVITNDTTLSTAPSTQVYPMCQMTLMCLVGDIHFSVLTTAPTTASLKMISGDILDLMVPRHLSLMSTSTGAIFQAIVWEG